MHIKTNPKDKISFNQLYNDYQTRFLNFANTIFAAFVNATP